MSVLYNIFIRICLNIRYRQYDRGPYEISIVPVPRDAFSNSDSPATNGTRCIAVDDAEERTSLHEVRDSLWRH